MARSSKRAPTSTQVRYAVVGLGHISQKAFLPGLAAAKHSRLTALVSDDPAKLRTLARAYGGAATYSYGGFDECLASGLVDAVYIGLPNDQHAQYAQRAAAAGVHVLCEKPMAVTSRDCERMIATAKRNDVRLMVAYRLHVERSNLRAIAEAKSGGLGELRIFNSVFTMQVADDDIRSRPLATGGGTLYDLGIYCINAARYLFRAEPVEVSAFSARRPGDRRFARIDEMTAATLRFPGERLATFVSSFGASATAAYDLIGTKASLRLDQAYEYEEPMTMTVTRDGKGRKTTFAKRDHFAAEIEYFSRCVLAGKDPEPDGSEGMADVRIIEALYESARHGRPVKIAREPAGRRRPDRRQEVTYPAARKPAAMVHVRGEG